jgi:hypothetical protein
MTDAAYMAAMQRDASEMAAEDLLAMYLKDIADLRAAVSGMTPDEVLSRPIAGKWSTLELVAHVADCEVFFTDRIVRTLAMDKPLLCSADENRYIARLNYGALDLAEELDLFTALRRHVGRILRQQPEEAWKRPGIHSQSGLVTVRQLVQQASRHVRHHLPFVAEKRRALAAK